MHEELKFPIIRISDQAFRQVGRVQIGAIFYYVHKELSTGELHITSPMIPRDRYVAATVYHTLSDEYRKEILGRAALNRMGLEH